MLGGQQTPEVLRRFEFHPATDATRPVHESVRALYRQLANELLDLVPPGRHQSLALTALQESMMWANAGVALDTPRPEIDPPA